MNYQDFSTLVGKTCTRVENLNDEEIIFETDDGTYKLLHYQDCCESVYVEDIAGDLDDLVGYPILQAEEVSGGDPVWEMVDLMSPPSVIDESHTWTFYKISTNRGSVTIRWLGTSNGYYSESVDFIQVTT